MIIAGIAVPVTEILTSRIPSVVYQSFYVYLYSVSIAFVVFVYTAHMRTRAVFSLIKSYRKFNFDESSFEFHLFIRFVLVSFEM